MEKGDCITLEYNERYYILILHHSITENNTTKHGFIILGESFDHTPSKSEIESSGILGDKYQNDTADLMNSAMRSRQKYDSSTFYTGVKYDLVTIPEPFFQKEKSRITIATTVNFNPEFYPMPNFLSWQNKYDELCEMIISRISKKDPTTVNWSTVYDAYPLAEVLKK